VKWSGRTVLNEKDGLGFSGNFVTIRAGEVESVQGCRCGRRDLVKVPRFSIGKMMLLVGIIALNLCVGRVLFAVDLVMLLWGAPAILILQFAVYRLIHERRSARARAFWAGFCLAGFLATLSLVWGFAFHESVNIGFQQTAGGGITKVVVKQPGFPSADRAWAIWGGYAEIVMPYLRGGFKRGTGTSKTRSQSPF
jgi:hypothetical protein